MKQDSTEDPRRFNLDWHLEEVRAAREGRDEPRTLWWYVARAKRGDQEAARMALIHMASSLSPDALRQNSGGLDPGIAQELAQMLLDVAHDGDSMLLRTARRGPPGKRQKDKLRFARTWWTCVDMYRLLKTDPSLTQTRAAEQVLMGDTVIGDASTKPVDADSLVRYYRRLEPDIAAHVDSEDSGTG